METITGVTTFNGLDIAAVVVSLAAVVVSLFALGFTIFSFWWLYARRGRLVVTTPRAYAFVKSGPAIRLRLPLSFYNTGAAAFVVNDLRLVFVVDPVVGPLDWIITVSALRQSVDETQASAVPFSVEGRTVTNLIAEFGRNDPAVVAPDPDTMHRLVLQGLIGEGESWVNLLQFDWWSPLDRVDYLNWGSYQNLSKSRPHS